MLLEVQADHTRSCCLSLREPLPPRRRSRSGRGGVRPRLTDPCDVLLLTGCYKFWLQASELVVVYLYALTNQNPLFCRVPINSKYGFILGTYKIVGSGWLRWYPVFLLGMLPVWGRRIRPRALAVSPWELEELRPPKVRNCVVL